MSEKQFKECSLSEATHVEVNDKVHLLENNKIALEHYHDECIGLVWVKEDAFIPKELFPVLGIKTFKEIKPEPVVFEATFVKYDGEWHRLFSLHGLKHVGCREARFRCVQILEEEDGA